jgi:hypothetical protein
LTWHYLKHEYVDPHAFPKILDVQIEPSSGLHYYSIDTISREHASTRKPSAVKANKKITTTPVKEVIFHAFELPQDYSLTNNRSHTEETTIIKQATTRRSYKQRSLERNKLLKQ